MGAKGNPNIEFSRLKELVSIDLPPKLDEVTYVANASNFRRALLNQFGKDGLDVRKTIEEHEDTRLTYYGHSRFLFNDLRFIFPKSEARGSNKYKKDVKFLAWELTSAIETGPQTSISGNSLASLTAVVHVFRV